MAHDMVDLMRSEAAAAAGDDEAHWLSHYAPDAVFRYPGDNPLAGEYRGHEGLREWRRRRAVIAARARLTAELHDSLGGDEHAVQLFIVTGEKDGRRASWRGAAVSHVRDGKITEVQVLVDPQAVVDDFLTSAGTA